MKAERRQHPRLSISVEVDVSSEHNFYSAKTRDISVGGLFIETDIALPIGTRIRVDLKFLKKKLQVEGEVTWVLVAENEQVTGVGVRFTDLSESAKKSIEAFMDVRAPMSFQMIESDDEGE
ncbi:MAG TPA: TIGR02266 family protein [Polyangiaceae bacterium]|jgi:uncharacterized protein (TIGR02266 family)|nr:TIGR02266 family protein [Polyangiaceae bacterium]